MAMTTRKLRAAHTAAGTVNAAGIGRRVSNASTRLAVTTVDRVACAVTLHARCCIMRA